MVAYLDANPTVGIVGPYTHNSDGSYQSTRRRFPTLATAFFESTWLQGFAPKPLLDRFYVNDAPPDQTLDVDWVQGSALMARREVYAQIGGLDEGYVMYSEELDWCKRAKARRLAGRLPRRRRRSPITAAKAAIRWSRGGTSCFSRASCATSANITARWRRKRCASFCC